PALERLRDLGLGRLHRRAPRFLPVPELREGRCIGLVGEAFRLGLLGTGVRRAARHAAASARVTGRRLRARSAWGCGEDGEEHAPRNGWPAATSHAGRSWAATECAASRHYDVAGPPSSVRFPYRSRATRSGPPARFSTGDAGAR